MSENSESSATDEKPNDNNRQESGAETGMEIEPQVIGDLENTAGVDSDDRATETEKKVLRLQADMENLRRRTRRETEDAIRYAAIPLVTDLLETIDNLDRALSTAESSDADQGLLEGVKMVRQQMEAVLEKHGCTKIESVGAEFDPNLHEAIQMQPSDEPANTVIQELRAGYRLHERVIRPSQVFISQP